MTIADIVPVVGEATNTEIFSCAEFGNLTVLEIDNEPWFVGREITNILGYENGSRDINRHVEDEDIKVMKYKASTEMVKATLWKGSDYSDKKLINESGLYSLVLSSKLESSKRFKRWVTKEILPNIRKHGMYATEELLDNPDLLIKVATQLKDEKEKRKALEQRVEEMKPKEVFADAVAGSDDCILVREMAKVLTQYGVKMGEKKLFSWLRERGYLIKKKGDDYNTPTQRASEMGLIRIKKTAIMLPNGSLSRPTSIITGKGQQYFLNKILEEKRNGKLDMEV